MTLEQKVVQLLIDTKKTLAIAESCTGGLLAHKITNIPGSSKCLKVGFIAYSNEAKSSLLGVKKGDLSKYGAVSEAVSIAMAKGARKKLNSDFGIGVTGIAGPDGGSKQKPVGLVYIAITIKDETLCLKCQFKGDRSSIKKQTSNETFRLLLEFLE